MTLGAGLIPGAELTPGVGVTTDAVAISAALAQPWATVVLSGAVSVAQLKANLVALRLAVPPDIAADLGQVEPADQYWAARAARPWT
jgi:aryl-alcohol dehydrogenase-like predicted oxidoreductase